MRKNAAKHGEKKNRGARENSTLFPEWMDLRALTRYAMTSGRTLRTWIHSPVDALPAVRVRGKILVNRRAFDAWLQAHTVKPTNSLKRNNATVSAIAVQH